MSNNFYYIGRPDGIGNRIEQLINIQEYCEVNNMKCVYIWKNSSFRNYNIGINFKHIEIRPSITEEQKQQIILHYPFKRSLGYKVSYNFTFTPPEHQEYDCIIHVRGTDRLSNVNKHGDFSTSKELMSYIRKTIDYVNKDTSIRTYTIVSDDTSYKTLLKSRIHKSYVTLPYHTNISKDWLDFYYLTKPNNKIIMCCKFSSYSICASILGDKKLLVFKNSLHSNLPRYKANVEVES